MNYIKIFFVTLFLTFSLASLSENALFAAMQSKNAKAILSVLEEGKVDINKPNKYDETPLMYAGYLESKGLISLLIQYGADVNQTNSNNRTVLHDSVIFKREKVIKHLIDNNADVNIKDKSNWTALHYAVFKNIDIVKTLVEAGADLYITNHKGNSPFLTAVSNNKIEIVKYLVSKDKKVVHSQNSANKNTALHIAAYSDFLEVTSVLIKNGADPKAKNEKNKTPLNVATGRVLEAFQRIY